MLINHCIYIFLSSLSKSDVENGYLNSPSSKNALFVFLPQNEVESRLVISTSIINIFPHNALC